MEKRLFIVSNRLPVNIESTEGKLMVKSSSGGLVSAINSYLSQDNSNKFSKNFWVGMPCCSPADWSEVSPQLASAEHDYIPVHLSKKTYDQYYNGLSNSTIWPLFHYIPSYAEYNQNNYNSYQKANIAFAEVLQKHLRPNDVLWIHDYHLMPLANLIRQKFPSITIGFFLHIPFPSFEIFRLLPKQWQHDILTGMLGADLIGFHTIDYATYFLNSVQMMLGYENDMNIVRHQNRLIKIDVFPISIDYTKFNSAYVHNKVVDLRNELKEKFKGKRIIFSVDRLDYTKGVSHRIEGYKCFLEKNQQYKEKVVFVMVIVPSREYIPKYAERKKMIDEMIGNINSNIGTLHWQPVIYQYNSLNFEEMLALYTACDLALITPLRDGMNLVAKEFAASRKDKQGVLLLSEMAGAARELTTALHINPNDVDEIADKIKQGFEMSDTEQAERMEAMQSRIKNYNVNTWANDFMTQLDAIKLRQQEFQVKFIDADDMRSMLQTYSNGVNRLFLLDYDGTLVSYSPFPEKAKPGDQQKNIIRDIISHASNHVYLISGRSSNVLDEWFSDLPINLIAEHGAKIKMHNKSWQTLVKVETGWKQQVLKIMEQYVKRCANTFIEEKEFCMVWHYRNANNEQSKLRSRELFAELNEFARHLGMQVIMGKKIVEVKPIGADKGSIVKSHLLKRDWDFIFAAGDDKTDEDMFRVLCRSKIAYTIKVGSEASFAKYNLHTPQMVLSLLQTIAGLPVIVQRTSETKHYDVIE